MDIVATRPQDWSQVSTGKDLLTRKGKDFFLMLVAIILTVLVISTKSTDTTVLEVPSGYFARPLVGGWKTRGVIPGVHKGVDFATEIGTPILASADGVIIVAEYGDHNSESNGGYGTYIIIQHPNGTQTLYGHMSKLKFAVGKRVSRGQEIGWSGNTGRVRSDYPGGDGAHLHFEVRDFEVRGRETVNPF